jgi:hypothetical protein
MVPVVTFTALLTTYNAHNGTIVSKGEAEIILNASRILSEQSALCLAAWDAWEKQQHTMHAQSSNLGK